jgi:hypothetical protein
LFAGRISIPPGAITIDAPPERVWPWIVQMGYKCAGFYTYDLVDNAGYASADQVLEEYQNFAVGDWAFNMNCTFGIEVPLSDLDAFRVKAFETTNGCSGRSTTARGPGR